MSKRAWAVAVATVTTITLGGGVAAADHPYRDPFANIQWPREPGWGTPKNVVYFTESWGEGISALFARPGADRSRHLLEASMEKLAELRAMVKADDLSAAGCAEARYLEMIDWSIEGLAAVPEKREREALASEILDRLLDHEYVLANHHNQIFNLEVKRDGAPSTTGDVYEPLIAAIRTRFEALAAAEPQAMYGSIPWRAEKVGFAAKILLHPVPVE